MPPKRTQLFCLPITDGLVATVLEGKGVDQFTPVRNNQEFSMSLVPNDLGAGKPLIYWPFSYFSSANAQLKAKEALGWLKAKPDSPRTRGTAR